MKHLLITEPRPAFLWFNDFRQIDGYTRVSSREARRFQGERAGPILFGNSLMPNAMAWVNDGFGFRRLALSGPGLFDIIFSVKIFSLDFAKKSHNDVLKLLFTRNHYAYDAASEFLEALKRRAARSIYAKLVGLQREKFPSNHAVDYYNLGKSFEGPLIHSLEEFFLCVHLQLGYT